MDYLPPVVQQPSAEDIREKAAEHYLDLSDEEVAEFEDLIEGMLDTYELLDGLEEPRPAVYRTVRDPGRRPPSEEDPYNVYITECFVEGAEDGPLSGYDVGLKDNISVAGVELTSGSKVLEGYVPKNDATIVTRILEAGGDVTGKLSMEDMSFSGGGELCAFGPVLNPRDTDYLAGGSSSGSAAAVAAGEVDVAIGCDQGGSVRMPASFCGVVGHKPTYGLVPYTGILGAGHTLDHAGPLANSTRDCARVLDVIAGTDPLDPRQGAVETDAYEDALTDAVDDVTVGTLHQGFAQSDDDVAEVVRDALGLFEDELGGLEDVSVPEHYDAPAIWTAIVVEAAAALFDAEALGHFGKGFYDTQLAAVFGQARRTRADDFPPTLKVSLVLGQYFADEYRGHYHAKAQNLRRVVSEAYDQALSKYDLLALPTTLTTAQEREEGLSRPELVQRGLSRHVINASPFNLTGHPAISVPCGTLDGLPVGLMFVGEQFDDTTVLRAAHAFERAVDWESL